MSRLNAREQILAERFSRAAGNTALRQAFSAAIRPRTISRLVLRFLLMPFTKQPSMPTTISAAGSSGGVTSLISARNPASIARPTFIRRLRVVVVMKDSPNGKRYGRRDPKGCIIEAYGFDLSPLASRYAEFQATAEAGREERARLQALKRRATIARNGIRQLLETAVEQRITGGDWEAHRAASSSACRGIAGRSGSVEMDMAVAKLERIQGDMRRYREAALNVENTAQSQSTSESVNLNPKQPPNWPHITPTTQLLNPSDTVKNYFVVIGNGLTTTGGSTYTTFGA